MLHWVEGFRQESGGSLREAVDAFHKTHLNWNISCDIMSSMDQEIRIAVDIDQQAEEGIPIKVDLKDMEGEPVQMFKHLDDDTPVDGPVTVDGSGGQIFILDGGKYMLHFKWDAADGNTREFESEIEIPIPPYCRGCEQRVPFIPDDDYICEGCRYGW
jgi:hypothetical protein